MKLYLSQTRFLWSLSGVVLAALASPSHADTLPPTPPATTSPSPATDSARAVQYLAMTHIQNLFKTSLDLSVQNATLEDIVGRVQKTLIARQKGKLPAVTIRGVRPVRLTFAVKDSTVGGVLNAAATLAGGRLWVLSDSALIIPAMSLPSESGATPNVLGEPWSEQNSLRVLTGEEKRQVLSSFVARSIGGPNATTAANQSGSEGGITFLPWESITSKTSFAQLSPDAQDMLQELVVSFKETMIRPWGPGSESIEPSGVESFNLSSNAQVGLSPSQNGTLVVRLPEGGTMQWSFNGVHLGWASAPPKSTATAPLPLDLSAGKS